ncbi:MAG: ERF family protein [Oscillospiraceae bacterium]|nr:ERF family protein [Oscillospiraceae bacterium]
MEKLNIYEALAKVLTMDYAVGKDEKNQQQGYKYRGIEKTVNAVKPLLAKVGVFYVPEVLNVEREERAGRNGGALIYSVLTVRYTFYAADGSSVSATVVGEGMDSGDKASNKAMSAALKYALGNVLSIPTEMIDSETESPDPEPKQKRAAAKKPAPADEDKLTRDEQSAVDIVGRILEGVTDAETATAAISSLAAVVYPTEHSRVLGRRAAASHMEALGLVYDAEAKAYKAKEEAPV